MQILAIVQEGEAGRSSPTRVAPTGATAQAYHRWKAKCGGMELSEAQRQAVSWLLTAHAAAGPAAHADLQLIYERLSLLKG